MSIIRTQHNKDNPYVMLNKSALEDSELSWAAKGLWSYLMSRPDNWTIRVSHLKNIYDKKGGGEKAIYSLLNELIEIGYCSRSQEKKDKGYFSNTEYLITEFKNKVPHSLQGDADEADAVKRATTNKRDLPNKEKKQQQEPAGGCVAFYDCLKEIDLTDAQKKSLMKHSEQEVKDAIAFVFREEFKLKTTLIQALKWAIKEKPELPKPVDIKKNRKYAEWAEMDLESIGWRLEALRDMVIINCKSPANPTEYHVRYSSPNFVNELNNILKKHQFVKGTNDRDI